MPVQTSMLSEEEFDEAARVVAAQRDWRYCRSRPDKFRWAAGEGTEGTMGEGERAAAGTVGPLHQFVAPVTHDT